MQVSHLPKHVLAAPPHDEHTVDLAEQQPFKHFLEHFSSSSELEPVDVGGVVVVVVVTELSGTNAPLLQHEQDDDIEHVSDIDVDIVCSLHSEHSQRPLDDVA